MQTQLRLTFVGKHECDVCGIVLPTRQQLGSHRFLAHGIRSSIRAKITGQNCVACLTHFSNRSLLHIHLDGRNEMCAEWYRVFVKDADPEEVDIEISEDRELIAANIRKGHQKFRALYPAGQL